MVKEKDQQSIFDLLDSPKPKDTIPSGLELKETTQTIILNLLRAGVGSTRNICDSLIETYNIHSERFLSGKPDIYPKVCLYLDSLVEQGLAVFVEGDIEDRKYHSM